MKTSEQIGLKTFLMTLAAIALVIPQITTAQPVFPLVGTMWTIDTSSKCAFGNDTLELGGTNGYLLKWETPTYQYGEYQLVQDTLELVGSSMRDYYDGGNGLMHPHKSIWRFILHGDTLTPFYFGAGHAGSLDTLDTMINALDKPCSFILRSNPIKRQPK